MILRSLLAALALLAAGTITARATPATDAGKAQCLIGERNDGYLGVVDGKQVDAVLAREMREVNQKRASAYEQLARKNGVSLDTAARATAEKLVNQASSGQCVQDASGRWIEVP